jgi:hypothetical protein
MQARFLPCAVLVAAMHGCYSTDGVTASPDDTSSSSSSGTDGSTSTTSEETTAVADETSSSQGESDETTSDCEPGVFGSSQLGNACFS